MREDKGGQMPREDKGQRERMRAVEGEQGPTRKDEFLQGRTRTNKGG